MSLLLYTFARPSLYNEGMHEVNKRHTINETVETVDSISYENR